MKKKILIVYNFFYPAYKAGGPIRSLKNLCDALSRKFEIFIITGDRDMNEDNPFPNIISNQWIKLDNYHVFYTKGGLFPFYLIYNEIKIIKPNIIYLQSFFNPLTWKTIFAGFFYRKKRIILAPRGEFYSGALQFKKKKKQYFISIIQLFSRFIKIEFQATAKQEKEQLISLFKKNKIWEAGNITDIPLTKLNFVEEKNVFSLLFVSRISSKKNLDFIINIFLNRKFNKKINIDIYGPIDDLEYWNKCLSLSSKLPSNITVNYHGSIDYYSLNSIYPNYHFFILPTHGENFGHAIYSSLANGLPVIISNKTPWQDLELYNAGFVLELDIDKFADTIQKCIDLSRQERFQMKKDALSYAQKFYNDSKSIKDTENMFLGIN